MKGRGLEARSLLLCQREIQVKPQRCVVCIRLAKKSLNMPWIIKMVMHLEVV